jgi:hypothetical protein
MKVWALSKSSEQRQLTLRVPADAFHKIQALEAMFPERSRNELVSDLLATALDEFEEGLPMETKYSEEVIGFDPDGEPIHESWEVGPRAVFRRLVAEASEGRGKAADLKAVETEEDAA